MTSPHPPHALPEAEQLVRYLLGELPPPDEAAIDEALADDAVWQAMQRAEDELLDAYADGQLDAARQQRLADRIAASPRLRERLALHADLHTLAHARRHRPRWPRGRVITAAALGAFAIAVVLALFLRGGAPAPTGGGTQVAALTLLPTTRAGAMPTVDIAGHGDLALSVVIDPEETFPRYRVRLTGPGAPWSQDGVTTTDGALQLRVPATALLPGAHQLAITGLGAHGETVALGARGFTVRSPR